MAEYIAPKHEVPEKSASAAVMDGPPPVAAGRPASSYGAGPQPQAHAHDPSKPPVKRQIVCFSFYKVMPEWRRLPAEEKAAHKAAFVAVLEKWNKVGRVSFADVFDGGHAWGCGYVRVVDWV